MFWYCWSCIWKTASQFGSNLHFSYYTWGLVFFHMYTNTCMSIAGTYYATQIKSKFVYYSHSGYRVTFLVNAAAIRSFRQNVVQIYRIPGPKISASGADFTTKIVYKWVYYKNIKVNFYLVFTFKQWIEWNYGRDYKNSTSESPSLWNVSRFGSIIGKFPLGAGLNGLAIMVLSPGLSAS